MIGWAGYFAARIRAIASGSAGVWATGTRVKSVNTAMNATNGLMNPP
jgi:hypothetical protein